MTHEKTRDLTFKWQRRVKHIEGNIESTSASIMGRPLVYSTQHLESAAFFEVKKKKESAQKYNVI